VRHGELLRKSLGVLEPLLQRLKLEDLSPEILALELREAQSYLDQIVGAITTEDMLSEIFSRFCIGK
ncbi:MAG: tRNA uridine-5-carboxymethylaminomethyl(34) synthesis GTPase MnmE, partial [Hydrogenobacter sp.]